jgi:ubiquinone/menaquinone biosynthesis C-methylase UbiE
MHRMNNEPRIKDAPETTGVTIHWAGQYEFFTRLLGLGTDGSNSRMVIELAHIKPGDHVLDVACGTGSLTLTARSAAGPTGKVHGIDAAPEMIEVARQKAARLHSAVVFDVGLIEQLAFPTSSFDVVISRLAIHHLPDDLKHKGFAEILRVLKPGGHLLIADFRAPSNPVLNHITSALVGGHMMQTDVWALPPMLASAGFAEVSSGPTRSAFLAFVSAKKPR